SLFIIFFFFQAEDGIRDFHVTGVQTCALPICLDLFPAFYHWGDILSFLSALLLCLHDPHPPNKDKPYCCGVILYPPQNKELTFGSLPKKEHPSQTPYNRRIQNKATIRLLNSALLCNNRYRMLR